MRSIAAAKSARTPSVRTPYAGASRTSCATCAARSTPFDGTQPKLRQSPPIRWRSTSATRAPSPDAPAAVTSPAVPAPTTTRL